MGDSILDPAMKRRNKRINAAWARRMDALARRSRRRSMFHVKRVNVRRPSRMKERQRSS